MMKNRIIFGLMALFVIFSVGKTNAGILVDNLAVINTILIESPTYMALTPDGYKLYVVKSPPQSTNAMGSVFVVDTQTETVVDEISLSVGFPQVIAITPDGTKGYLAVSKGAGSTNSTGSNRVDVIDISSNTITTTIPIAGSSFGTTGVAVTPDGSRVYVTHRNDNRVDVINTTTNTVIDSVFVGSGRTPMGIAITPDGTRAYVANRSTSTVTVIDTSTNTIADVIPLSLNTSPNTTFISITPDGTKTYVSNRDDSRVSVIDTNPSSPTFNQEFGTITTTGTTLSSNAINSDGSLAFVNGFGTDELFFIDIDPGSPNFHTQVGMVSVGDRPWDVVSQTLPVAVAYVANRSGSVSVIGLNLIEVTIDIKPGSDPNSINLGSSGVVPVAILSSPDFDAPAEVDPDTISLAGAAVKMVGKSNKLLCHSEDVNGDGLADLVCQVETEQFIIEPGDSVAVLEAETFGGTPVRGEDSIRIVPDN